jgi:BarA-like signal transduction histidine kinase
MKDQEMKFALTLAAFAVLAAPAMAAGCSEKMKDETASSCMAGSTWDPVKGACTATPSS